MRKLAILTAVALLVMLVVPATVLASDIPSDAITVSVTGNGTWSGGVLSLSLFPGESKCFKVAVHSNWDSELFLEALATPGCVSGSDVTACFCPGEATLGVNATCIFNLTVAASGSAPPSALESGGVFSANLTISASEEAAGNVTEPEPEPGVPHHITFSLAQDECVVGDSHEVTATVYDAGDNPLSGVSVSWTITAGNASATSAEQVTDGSGRVHATFTCSAVGVSEIRCKVEGTDVLSTVDLVWIADTGGDENGGDSIAPDIRQPISSISFGEVLVRDTPSGTVIIYNDGDAPLVVSSVVWSSGSEDFAYAGPLAPFTINSGGSANITVRFAPSSVEDLSAAFTVTSNDPDTPGLSFTVSGTGKSRGQPAWKMFLIGVLIIGGGFSGYIYYKRWKAKKNSADWLAKSGEEEDDGLALD